MPFVYNSHYKSYGRASQQHKNLKNSWAKIFGARVSGYLFAVIGIAAVTAVLAPFHERLSSMTVALALLLIVFVLRHGLGQPPGAVGGIAGRHVFQLLLPPAGLHLYHH